jgi:peptide/nickel transport system ATP-binding protein
LSAALPTPIVQGTALTKTYPVRQGWWGAKRPLVALDHVDIAIGSGQTVALVGESGCGKSTLARILTGLIPPSGGQVSYQGTPVEQLEGEGRRTFRRNVQMVVQDPYSSLSPRMRIAEIVEEPMVANGWSRDLVRERTTEVLEEVGLDPVASLDKDPHEFSGGQRQRIAIARAVAPRPEVIVLDEPVSALDVSIRAQVLNLLRDLQDAHGVSYLMVTHDLADVASLADEVVVLFLGRVVERGATAEVLAAPVHPYTQALVSAVPSPRRRLDVTALARFTEVPSPLDPPSGCHFHPRCPVRIERCSVESPALRPSGGGAVACHLVPTVVGTPDEQDQRV